MRIDLADSQWIELRDPGKLNGGDKDAFDSVYEPAFAQDVPLDGDDEPELSDDGTAMRPKLRRTVRVTMAMVHEQRDILLGRLITAWSFTDIPLPYQTASRELLPLDACQALEVAVRPHMEKLREAIGPKGKTGTTFISGNGLREESPASQQA